MTINKKNNENIIAIIISLFVFTYLLFRALNIPIVHDEAATFFYYIQSGKFLPYNAHWDANNHFLNSFLSFISYRILGNSELIIRLPNLISFLIFAFYSFKISSLLTNKSIRWIFFLSLIFAHNFIEYFALSRGYGLSMAFLLAAIWQLFKVIKNSKITDIILTLVFINLAVLANLTLITSMIIIIGIITLNLIINKKSNIASTIISISIFGITPFIFFTKLLFDYKKFGLLYYGNHDGFIDNTLSSIIYLLFNSEQLILIYIIISVFIIFSIRLIIINRQKSIKAILNNKIFVFSALLYLNIVAISILGIVADINYPEDRTAIYLFPFFIGSFLFILDDFTKNSQNKISKYLAIPLLIFPLHFIANMNISYSSFWKNERIESSFVEKVKFETNNKNKQATIGGSHIRVLCWAYNNYKLGGKLNQVQRSIYPEYYSDYQIVDTNDYTGWRKYYHEIAFDEYSKLSLLKRNSSKSKIIYKSTEKSSKNTKDEYYNICKMKVDSLTDKVLIANISFTIESITEPFNTRLILSVNSENNENNQYDYIALNWKQLKWDKAHNTFKGSFIINKLNDKKTHLGIYLWNIDKSEFSISNIETEIGVLD